MARLRTIGALVSAALVSAAVVLGCGPKAATPSTEVPVPDEQAEGPDADARDAPGAVLKATIPRLDGGTIALSELHGMPVVLVLAITADPTFERLRTVLDDLVARHADHLRVVVVAMDPTDDLVPRVWAGGPESVVLGWDPQGALATRLQARTLPTVFVLDREGRILVVRAGAGDAMLSEVVGGIEGAVGS